MHRNSSLRTTEGQIGLVYQYRDPGNYYEVLLETSGFLRVGGFVDGSGQTHIRRYVGLPRGLWFDLEVQWNNGVTTVSVNGP
jgi:hypothetical protein